MALPGSRRTLADSPTSGSFSLPNSAAATSSTWYRVATRMATVIDDVAEPRDRAVDQPHEPNTCSESLNTRPGAVESSTADTWVRAEGHLHVRGHVRLAEDWHSAGPPPASTAAAVRPTVLINAADASVPMQNGDYGIHRQLASPQQASSAGASATSDRSRRDRKFWSGHQLAALMTIANSPCCSRQPQAPYLAISPATCLSRRSAEPVSPPPPQLQNALAFKLLMAVHSRKTGATNALNAASVTSPLPDRVPSGRRP